MILVACPTYHITYLFDLAGLSIMPIYCIFLIVDTLLMLETHTCLPSPLPKLWNTIFSPWIIGEITTDYLHHILYRSWLVFVASMATCRLMLSCSSQLTRHAYRLILSSRYKQCSSMSWSLLGPPWWDSFQQKVFICRKKLTLPQSFSHFVIRFTLSLSLYISPSL